MNNVQHARLGPLQTCFFSWVQLKGRERVRTGDLVEALALTPKQEADLLDNLNQSGWIVQLQRGKYLVPDKIPPGGKWVPSEFAVLAALMAEVEAKYQITGPAAFQSYGLDTQVPNELAVYNTILSGRRLVGGLSFLFIKVASQRIGGERTFNIRQGEKILEVNMSSFPRTLCDAVYDYSRFGTLPKAYEWIAARQSDIKLMRQLVQMVEQFGNLATKRRVGFLFETLGIYPAGVNRLKESLSKTKSLIPFIPGQGLKGSTNKTWGLILNGQIPIRQ